MMHGLTIRNSVITQLSKSFLKVMDGDMTNIGMHVGSNSSPGHQLRNRMFYVIRTYTHTDLKQLWKVESRPIVRKEDAESWKDFVEMEYYTEHPRSEHKFSVVELFE
jgi:hypothetical protein